MVRHVAFLRGMNVGGHRVTSAELCEAFDAMGLPDAATFRASGNVIFDAPEEMAHSQLRERIERGLEGVLGYAVPTLLRTAGQTRAIAAHQPFEERLVAESKGKVQVALLADPPTPAVRAESLAFGTEEDRLAIDGSELYWLPSGRMSDSLLELGAIPALQGVTTMRTKGTIELIAAKHCPGPG